MTISYNWLSDYLPQKIAPEKLSQILTAIGLEVEKMELFEEVRGGLKDLLIGEVLEVEKHPNADKLKLTKVTVNSGEPLQIVCGAPNVAAGQKVLVAPVGTTIYPINGEPVTMKLAKIRGVESQGIICAEDEVGLGTSHEGILILNDDARPGTAAEAYFKPYTDIVYEIGLTPNRMDAMSHLGVARDVCAYLSHHEKKEVKPVWPAFDFKVDNHSLPVEVVIENTAACKRYSGVSISNIKVKESPKWLQKRLKAIGLRAVNNIVDVTNYIQHETGQPLHAFNYDAISGKKIIVKNEPEGTPFITLDERQRKLSNEDLMICNSEVPMCIAGVFGGKDSGVTDTTTNIFLESAWFDPIAIRKTSFRHGLRTDAAARFEKGVDISATVTVLQRAATLIKEVAGGAIASDIVDVYPAPAPKKQVAITYAYLKKLSGKNYPSDAVKSILQSLDFEIVKEDEAGLHVAVPYHKSDVSLPADIVEEVLRIDGLNNIDIPAAITITPSVEQNDSEAAYTEKVAALLTGRGFTQILTNSITNSAYYTAEELEGSVRLLNNLSVELDIMRPQMLQTALEVIAFNINRKNGALKLFEWGKTYRTEGVGRYIEQSHLCIYLTGLINQKSWNEKEQPADIYFIKGMAEAVLQVIGINNYSFNDSPSNHLQPAIGASINGQPFLTIGEVTKKTAALFDIKQPVFVADFDWDVLLKEVQKNKVQYKEVPKYPAVERDLAMIVPKSMRYQQLEEELSKLSLNKLQHIHLFDVFESEKLGPDKKSFAVNFIFLDEEKTLTDKEIDGWMQKIITVLEKISALK